MSSELWRSALGSAALTFDHPIDRPASATRRIPFDLSIVGNAYSYAGNYQVDSSLKPGTRVLMAPLAINMKYADDALRLATQASGINRIGWLKANDIATMSAMVQHMRRGYPLGEALQQAYVDHAIA